MIYATYSPDTSYLFEELDPKDQEGILSFLLSHHDQFPFDHLLRFIDYSTSHIKDECGAKLVMETIFQVCVIYSAKLCYVIWILDEIEFDQGLLDPLLPSICLM